MESFYEDGKLAETKNYVNGKREGLYQQLSENGKVIFEMHYKADKEHGQVKIYYANGNLRETGVYKNGRKEGPWLEYDTDSKVMKKEVYKNGFLQQNLK
ncbi:MAG: hypothetical protein IPK10_01015 [Bacteroidetes bacterium]|nr:hypothetical protein [Bacteroidota bacterium]